MDENSDIDNIDEVTNIDPDEEEEEEAQDDDEEEDEDEEEEEADDDQEPQGPNMVPSVSSSRIFAYSIQAFKSYIHKGTKEPIQNRTQSLERVLHQLIKYRGFTQELDGYFKDALDQKLIWFDTGHLPTTDLKVFSNLTPDGPWHTLIWVDHCSKKLVWMWLVF